MPTIFEHLNSFAESVITWQLGAIFDSLVLLGIVFGLWYAFRKRLSPQWGGALFLLVLLKAVSHVVLPVPDTVANLSPFRHWKDDAAVTVSEEVITPPETQRRPIIMDSHLYEPPPYIRPEFANYRTVFTDQTAHVPETLTSPPQENPAILPMDSVNESKPLVVASSVSVPEHAASVSPVSRFSIRWPLAILSCWCLIVACLSARQVFQQFAFMRRIDNARTITASELPLDFDALRRSLRLGVIALRETDVIDTPVVYGLFRPVILLPGRLLRTVSPAELRWILLHELGHLKRHDLWVVLFIRIVSILFFFNPAVWVSRLMIDRLREYSCDDFATHYSHATPLEASEAFLKILKHVTKTRSKQLPALAALDSRNPVFQRMQRLLDSDRRSYSRFGTVSVLLWIVLAAVLIPRLVAQEKPAIINSETKTIAKSDTNSKNSEQTLQIKIVDPEGRPVPNADFVCRAIPKPTNWPGDAPKFESKADANGEYTLRWNADHVFDQLDIEIVTPGFAPHLARWEFIPSDPIPDSYTARLEKSLTIGGRIVDEANNPLPNTEVTLSQLQLKDRVGLEWSYEKTFYTDTNGVWTFDSFPSSPINENILLSVNHPEFAPNSNLIKINQWLPDAQGKFSKELTIRKGKSLSGRILDESGNPIPNATVIGTWAASRYKKTTADHEGRFQILYLPEDGWSSAEGVKEIQLIARVDGKTTVVRTVAVSREEENPSAEITLPASKGDLKIRVVDQHGKAVENCRLGLMEFGENGHWMSLKSLLKEILGYDVTDSNGVFTWPGVPDGKLRFSPRPEFLACLTPDFTVESQEDGKILPDPGGYTTPLLTKTGENDYTLTLSPRFEVYGKVVDVDSGEPIFDYRVFQGFKRGPGDVYWRQGRHGFVRNGIYTVNDDDDAEYFQIRIESVGYETHTSEPIEGRSHGVAVDFVLKKLDQKQSENVYAIITPDGNPATGAYVSIATLNPNRRVPQIHNGKPLDSGGFAPKPYVLNTDSTGRFNFPNIDFAQERKEWEEYFKDWGRENMTVDDFAVLILHETGGRFLTQQEIRIPGKG